MTDRRRVLILGAGVYQVPLIEAAGRRGLETVVLSRPGPYSGVELADRFLPVDTTDVDAVLAAARELSVAAVVTAGTDVCLPSLGRVVDALGLSGPGAEAARVSADKSLMKAAFAEQGVTSARFAPCADLIEARRFAGEIGFPLMVKPTSSSGSRGVVRVDRPEELAGAWAEAEAAAGRGGILVERCLVGLEYGAQAVVHGERVVEVVVHNDTVTPPPVSTPLGHSFPADLPPALVDRTAEVVARAVAALGLTDCVANADLMLVDDEPHVIELSGRMGATGLAEIIAVGTGWDLYDHVLGLALGDAAPLPAPSGRPNALELLRSDRGGRVLSLEVPPEIRDHPDLVDIQWDVAPGDEVRAFRVGPDRVGSVQVVGASARAAEEFAAACSAAIDIELEERT